MQMWLRVNLFLNKKRLGYAWIAGGAMWAAWLINILLGSGIIDHAGHVIGTDYIQFYAAGVTLISDRSSRLYDFEYQRQLEKSIAGEDFNAFHAFITPPFFAFFYIPFAKFDYVWSYIIWFIVNLLFLWFSVYLLRGTSPKRVFFWTLTWFPVFACFSYGQNSILSLAILSLTYYFWKSDKRIIAGMISSLLLYKPQLLLGLVILWLLEWRHDWRSLLGLAAGAGVLVGTSFYFMPEASIAYINFALTILPRLSSMESFPIWHSQTLESFWLLLFPGKTGLAAVLAISMVVIALIALIRLWFLFKHEKLTLFAFAICFTILITPHAMIYDWILLLIPAVVLWYSYPNLRDQWKPLFAAIWVSTFVSDSFTIMQLKLLPLALQIDVPIYLLVLVSVSYFLLTSSELGPGDPALSRN